MKRILVFCGDPWHPAATVRQGLEPLGALGFDFEFADGGWDGCASRLKGCAAAVLAKANIVSAADAQPWLTPASENGLVEFVERGGGLLAVHGGISRYDHLPGMNVLLGGSFVNHPRQCAVTVQPKANDALTRDVHSFSVQDEHYFVKLADESAEVFLHSRSAHGDQPAGWRRNAGAGRVGVLTPGHNADVWRHPEFQKLLLNVLRWTTENN